MRHSVLAAVMAALFCVAFTSATALADPGTATARAVAGWNQWRGPDGNGVSPGGPPLASEWPKDGPNQVWVSEKIASSNEGGFGCVSVAGGKAYLYSNQKYKVPFEWRKLTADAVRQLGWTGTNKLPEELSAQVEQARVSEERAKVTDKERGDWVKKWIAEHVKEADRKAQGPLVGDRLNRGKGALPLDVLDKLSTIRDKEFANQADLDKWYDDNQIPAPKAELDKARKDKQTIIDYRQQIAQRIPTFHEKGYDVLTCIDKDGKTAWQFKADGMPSGWALSATPAIADGKVFIPTSSGSVYCLDANKGEVIWKTGYLRRPPFYRSVQGKVESFGPAAAGKVSNPKVETVAIAYTYTVGGKEFKGAVTQELFPLPAPAQPKKAPASAPAAAAEPVKPKTDAYQAGKEVAVWYDPDRPEVSMLDPISKPPFEAGGAHSSIVVAGNAVYVLAGTLTALSAANGEVLWTQPKVRGGDPSPTIWKSGDKSYVLVLGGQVACVDAATGSLSWSTTGGGGRSTVAVSGDYAVIQTEGKDAGKIVAYKLSPEKAEQAWEVKASDGSATPAIYKDHVYTIADNRALCIELVTGKVCWDEKVPGSWSSVVVADGKIFANSANLLVMWPANPEKFVQPFKTKIKMCEYTGPAVADGKLYVRTKEGVACYDVSAAGVPASAPAK